MRTFSCPSHARLMINPDTQGVNTDSGIGSCRRHIVWWPHNGKRDIMFATKSIRARRYVGGLAVTLGLIVGAPTAVQAASTYALVNGTCQIKVTGFEDWGKAAASTRDANADCSTIRARIAYKDSSNSQVYLVGVWTSDEYTNEVAGVATDWVKAYGSGDRAEYYWASVTR